MIDYLQNWFVFVFCLFVCFCGTGAWTQGLNLEHSIRLFCLMGIFKIGSRELFPGLEPIGSKYLRLQAWATDSELAKLFFDFVFFFLVVLVFECRTLHLHSTTWVITQPLTNKGFFFLTFLLVYNSYTGGFIVTFPYTCTMYPSLVHPFHYSPSSPTSFLKWHQQFSHIYFRYIPRSSICRFF
jgi:hypothetical protein